MRVPARQETGPPVCMVHDVPGRARVHTGRSSHVCLGRGFPPVSTQALRLGPPLRSHPPRRLAHYLLGAYADKDHATDNRELKLRRNVEQHDRVAEHLHERRADDHA